MSVAVGLEVPGGVWLGWDGCASDDSSKIRVANKGFSVCGLGFAFVGDFRSPQIVEQNIDIKRRPPAQSTRQWVVRALVPALQAIGDKHKLWDNKPPDERGFDCLVAIRGHCYAIQGDWSVLRSLDAYSALGHGAQYALGSFASTENLLEPRERVEAAVRAAIRHCPTVSEPVFVAWVPA